MNGMSAEDRFQEQSRKFLKNWPAASSLMVDVGELVAAAKAAARADERVKARNEGIVECVNQDMYVAVKLDRINPADADAARSSAMEHRKLLKLPEAQPVEPQGSNNMSYDPFICSWCGHESRPNEKSFEVENVDGTMFVCEPCYDKSFPEETQHKKPSEGEET